MPAPAVTGIHHVKIAVVDLGISRAWYEDVLGATHLPELDHTGIDGSTFASIVVIPGVAVPIELRWAPVAAVAQQECDVLVSAVDTGSHLAAWVEHLDALGVEHSALIAGPGVWPTRKLVHGDEVCAFGDSVAAQ